MKFQYKALVAALALSAATIPAQAAMTFATSGSSSMILTLLDFNSNMSATFDLGYSYDTFQTMVTDTHKTGVLSADGLTKTMSFDLAGGNYANAWSSFWSVASTSTTKWAIYAADGTGSGAGARGIISTYKSGANLTNSNQLQTSVANFNSYMTNNNALDNHNSVEDGASVVTTNTSQAYAGRAVAYGATGRINAQGHVSMNNMDQSMTVVQQLTGATAASPVAFNVLSGPNGDYTFKMTSTGLLEFVIPVPEADSYAMLLAGLGVIGLVARRRKA
ncbi:MULTISPECIES: PEP-CTERM sorting domain-containing protein [unclassified Methylophilus]|uniref:PEP-CTERM sorting domain-containing protein n=1 Tax=unclassified Methylophilus TaxID=2630143 RepID=UPI0023B23297|nr:MULTISPECIES: PEP-CTERM sorting domain-containing protein [unclassified Methylophilus]MDF0378834.1 PEP-CTERM sorting domain-containing protein [Methylophilus sp. YYY-1]MDT7847986.1 PEP-CTERM sorting domain-containing protein [Methylophilus sp. VKM B-3414]